MAKITLIGDVHGKIERLMKFYDTLKNPSIQLGDMGVGFGFVPHFDLNHTFIRGNHDDPAKCRQHKNYMGEYGYRSYGSEGGIFYVGGAFSIDKAWREMHRMEGGKRTWWPEEELSPETLNRVKELYLNIKPRIVVSHEAPAKAGAMLLAMTQMRLYKGACFESRTAQVFNQMFEEHQPELWVFGHYHISKTFFLDKTYFVCLNELEFMTIDTENPAKDLDKVIFP